MLIGFFLLETAWYALFTEHASRLHITTGTHPGSRRGREFWELFRRYKIAPWHWQLAIFSSVPAALGLFGFGKHQSRLLALVTSAYLVVLTFHHRPFEYPFHPYLPDHTRYFYAATPLLIASVVTFFATALRAWMAQSFERLPQRLVRPAAAIGRHPALVALGCTVLFGSYAWINSKSPLRPKAMQEVIEYRSIALKAYRSGVPIVATNRHWKAVDIIRKLFLPRDAILNADGSLDPPKRLKAGKYTYLLSSGPADRAVERAIRSGRCSVQFTRRRTGHGGTQLRLVKARYEPHCLDKFRTKIRAAAKD